MHPDFDFPERHLSREPFDEPDHTCSDCHGTRVLDGEECVYCDGTGVREPRVESDAERRERVRFHTRCLTEPGYQMAVTHLLLQRLALTAGSHPADPASRPADATGGCDVLSAQTPGPAGLSALVGIARGKAA